VAAIGATAVLAACGGSGGGPGGSPTPSATATQQPTPAPTPAPTATQIPPTPTATPVPAATVSVYLLRDGKVAPVRRGVSPLTPAFDSVVALLGGPAGDEAQLGFTSDVPTTARIISVSIAGGVATADFTSTFTANTTGALTGYARVAEVVYTLTQFSSVRSVTLRIDGRTVAGGLTRSSEESFTPAIFVEAPVAGQSVSSPLRVWGTANTFEGVFRIRMWMVNGPVIFDYPVQATSGTGTRGTFDVTVRFTNSGLGTLEVYEVSMKDGSHVKAVDLPVTLLP